MHCLFRALVRSGVLAILRFAESSSGQRVQEPLFRRPHMVNSGSTMKLNSTKNRNIVNLRGQAPDMSVSRSFILQQRGFLSSFAAMVTNHAHEVIVYVARNQLLYVIQIIQSSGAFC